jgi:hypothetical protein
VYKQPPIDRERFQRAVVVSVLLHSIAGMVGYCGMKTHARGAGSQSLVDIELAPPAPKAEVLPPEIVRQLQEQLEQAAQASIDKPKEPDKTFGTGGPDAAMPDAEPAPDARRRKPDAAELVAMADAAPAEDASSTTVVAVGGDGGYVNSDGGHVASIDPGTGSGGGDPGAGITGTEPIEGGDPGTGSGGQTSPGTAANLLAYFPKGHVVTAMIRFDRIRGTRWQAPVDDLFRPMPDHITVMPPDKGLGDLFDVVVISSFEPSDPRAGTLVVKHHVTRPEEMEILNTSETPVTWSVARGGAFGKRGPGERVTEKDERQFLFPFKDWLLLGHPRDLPGMFDPAKGDLDTAVATGKLPAWLANVRSIVDESGTGADGPTLVLTLAPKTKRYDIPDIGLDIASVPAPERLTVSLEFVKGFIVRGNMKFRTEKDAKEFVESATRARDRILDSTILKAMLKRAKALNAVTNLDLHRQGERVSYGTSVSLGDADAILAISAQWLTAWFTEASQRAADKDAGKTEE